MTAPTLDIVDILGRIRRPERVVELCLDGTMVAEHDDLTRQLADVQRESAVTMAGTGRAVELAQAIRDLEQRMAAAKVPFRVRGLSAHERQQWLDAHPARDGKQELFNPETGAAPLIAACAVNPVMSVEQATVLYEQLGTGQFDQLFAACWEATSSDGAVPFSVAASLVLAAGSAPKL